jgi:tetratricopeptide (TPR) repeat protein
LVQHRHHAHPDALEQLESLGDRLVRWIGDNPVPVLIVAGAILVGAAAYGGLRAWGHSRENSASTAEAGLVREYVVAMGGEANSLVAPEPANPETARTVRTQFVDRFVSLAKDHEGTAAAGLARIEASRLYEQLGAGDQAVQVLQDGLAAMPADSAIRGVTQARVAALLEAAGDFAGAAAAYEAVAAIPDHPLRELSLGDAARCWLEAGQRDKALAAYEQLRATGDVAEIPPHIKARLEEVRLQP